MTSAVAPLLAGLLLLASCRSRDDFYLEGLRQLERPSVGEPGGRGASGGGASRAEETPAGNPASVEQLEREIERYRDIVGRKVEASGKLGTYYKMLALRYVDLKMYGEAYSALQEAVRIYPENPILFELSGACAGRMGRATANTSPGSGSEERDAWLKAAEGGYARAIELDPAYVEALYGLAVLRTYELNRPEEAEPLVDRILARERQNVEAMFLKGQILYRTGRLQEAAELYGKIADLTGSEERRRSARENRRRIEEELDGR